MTMTANIVSPEFNTLLARLTQAEDQGVYREAHAKLIAFINGWAFGQRHKAVEEFKAVCQYQGLTAVVADELIRLDDQMKLLARESKDALAETDHEFLARGIDGVVAAQVDVFKTNVEVPGDLTPEFTVLDSPELDELLNNTASLLSGRANMDVGIAWHESFNVVHEIMKVHRRHTELLALKEPTTEDEVATVMRTLARHDLSEEVWNNYVNGDKPLSAYLPAEMRTHSVGDEDEYNSTLDKFEDSLSDLVGFELSSLFGDSIEDVTYAKLLHAIWNEIQMNAYLAEEDDEE